LKKNIFKKCNFLIIIFFLQIAQATTLEKFNVTCFPCGWHNKNISFCSMFSNHNVWNETLLVFRVLFSRIFFSNRNVWNTSLLVFRVSFSCTCSNRNVWNTSLLVWCYQTFSRTFSKTNSFSSENLFFTSLLFYLFLLQNVPILQHAIASKSIHSNTMLPNVMVLAPLQKLKINRFLHTFLGKTGWSSTSDRNFMSFREWSAAKRAKRHKHFYHERKITRAFPTTHVSTYFFRKPTTFTIANS
jgi:hypothetical protein